jgi:hypothetical protein
MSTTIVRSGGAYGEATGRSGQPAGAFVVVGAMFDEISWMNLRMSVTSHRSDNG